MSTLITGGAGFIGGWLARALADAGETVDILDDFSRGQRDTFLDALIQTGKVRLIDSNMIEAGIDGLGAGYTTIYHFAARVGVANVLGAPFDTLRDNVLLVERAIELARRQTALDRFVFASTSEVYAGSLEHMDLPLPTPETTPIALTDLAAPRSSYMFSKLYGEAMVLHAGIPFTILRPHNIYGPRMGMAHVIPELLRKAHEAPDGGSIEVYSVDHTRTFCFIDDAIDMMRAVAATPACNGETLNLGCQTPETAIGDLAQIVIDTVGKTLAVDAKPPTAGSPARRCPDMSRMTALTGREAGTSLADGVRRTYAWYDTEVLGTAA